MQFVLFFPVLGDKHVDVILNSFRARSETELGDSESNFRTVEHTNVHFKCQQPNSASSRGSFVIKLSNMILQVCTIRTAYDLDDNPR